MRRLSLLHHPTVRHTNGLIQARADGSVEVFLRPGEWYCGGHESQVTTLLGSCVSVVLWHPAQRVGAMCHYVLERRRVQPVMGQVGTHGPIDRRRLDRLEGKYGTDALAWMAARLTALGCRLQDTVATVAGGARIASQTERLPAIGDENIAFALDWLDLHGVPLKRRDTGDAVARRLGFNPHRGTVDIQRTVKATETEDSHGQQHQGHGHRRLGGRSPGLAQHPRGGP